MHMGFALRRVTFHKHLKALRELKGVLHCFVSAVISKMITFLRKCSFIPGRGPFWKASAYLSKEKHSLQRLSKLREKGMLRGFLNAVVWAIITSFGFREGFVRKAYVSLSKVKPSLQTLQSIVRSERSIASFAHDEVWKLKPVFWKCT